VPSSVKRQGIWDFDGGSEFLPLGGKGAVKLCRYCRNPAGQWLGTSTERRQHPSATLPYYLCCLRRSA